MFSHIIGADILLITHIFPSPYVARKNTSQLAKYPRILFVKLSTNVYLFHFQLVLVYSWKVCS